MKNSRKHLSLSLPLLLAASLFLLASCDKYEGPDPMEETPSAIISTSWQYTISDSVAIENPDEEAEEETIMVDYTVNTFLIFKTDRVGLIKQEVSSNLHPAFNSTTDIDYTYDYTTPNGTIHYWYMNTQSNVVKADIPFVVNGQKLTIDLGDGPVDYERL